VPLNRYPESLGDKNPLAFKPTRRRLAPQGSCAPGNCGFFAEL